MTLQGSGAISFSQIRAELGSSSWSLRTLSAEAGKDPQDSMSEFYGYTHLTCVQYEVTNVNGDWYEPTYLTWINCDPYYGGIGMEISAAITYGETRLICAETKPESWGVFFIESKGGCPS